MSRAIDDIAAYLEAQAIGTVGTDIFKGQLPDEPGLDNVIAVFERGGTAPSMDIPTKSPSFQVIVRNKDYAAGRDKLEAVRTALHRQYNVQLVTSGVYFYRIVATSEGGSIGRDAGNRDEFSINFSTLTR